MRGGGGERSLGRLSPSVGCPIFSIDGAGIIETPRSTQHRDLSGGRGGNAKRRRSAVEDAHVAASQARKQCRDDIRRRETAGRGGCSGDVGLAEEDGSGGGGGLAEGGGSGSGGSGLDDKRGGGDRGGGGGGGDSGGPLHHAVAKEQRRRENNRRSAAAARMFKEALLTQLKERLNQYEDANERLHTAVEEIRAANQRLEWWVKSTLAAIDATPAVKAMLPPHLTDVQFVEMTSAAEVGPRLQGRDGEGHTSVAQSESGNHDSAAPH